MSEHTPGGPLPDLPEDAYPDGAYRLPGDGRRGVRWLLTWAVAELEYAAGRVGLRGYCWPCDRYGWMLRHRRHAACWRGSPRGRDLQAALSESVAADPPPGFAIGGPVTGDGGLVVDRGCTYTLPPAPHRCPYCGTVTVYQAFSGGREWYCEPCDTTGEYPQGAAPRRVQMLADGRIDDLKAEMRAESARRYPPAGDVTPTA